MSKDIDYLEDLKSQAESAFKDAVKEAYLELAHG